MSYKAEITVDEDVEGIYKTFLPEKISRERSTVSVKKEKGLLKITIEAKDAVAMRASANAVTQVLAVYGKMKEVS